MKKKSLLLILLMALIMPFAANAQQTQTLLTEDFNSITSLATSYSATNLYTYNAGSGNNWTLSTSDGTNSSKCAKYVYNSSNAANCYLVSAPFNVNANMTELTVSLQEKTGSYTEKFEAFFVKASEVTDNASVVTATHHAAIATASYTNTDYAAVTGSNGDNALAGQSVRLVVHCTSAADQYYLCIDDITVTETFTTTDPYIMLDPTSATIITGFTQTITATYGNVTGTPTITYTTSDATVASVTGSGTTATVTGISVGTATITATMNGSYTATCAITVEAPHYCTPAFSYTSTNYGLYIAGFNTEDGETNITTNSNNGLSTGGYGDYYSTLSASAEAGQTIGFTVTPAGTVNAMMYAMWIDWNLDYDFEDDGELIAQSGSIQTDWTGTISIPADAPLGDHRIRIIGMYSGTFDPCISATFGEAEDYKLTVLEAADCQKPSNLQLTALGNEVTATWDGDAVSFNIDINGTVTTNATTGNTYTFTGDLSTTYVIKVQANCEGNQTSDWSNEKSVTTDDCMAEDQCLITIQLTDAYGDGGGKIQVVNVANNVLLGEFLGTGYSSTYTLSVCNGVQLRFSFVATDSYSYENGYVITDSNDEVIAEHEGCDDADNCTAPSGVIASYTVNCAPLTCPKPTDLDYDNVGPHSVELSWIENGSATTWQICINNDMDNLIEVKEDPYILTGLKQDTEYSVMVRAYCDDEDQSKWSTSVEFATEEVCPEPTNLENGTPEAYQVELSWTAGGEETTWQICVNNDMDNLIEVKENPYTLKELTQDTDYTIMVRAYCDDVDQSNWSDAVEFTTAVACERPENLAESNITFTSAELGWEGTNNSYVLEYRPWYQVGEDQIATAVLTPYTFDLSEYSGTGSIAIRHYDVSDMFMLNVDDIVVKNAGGTTVYSQDFESGTIPSNITNMDLDGDGNEWEMRAVANDNLGNPTGNGNYCVSSASWISGVAVHPDNWLIISGIELGGEITFIARGQDPEWPSENFAVYVSAEADLIVETDIYATSYLAKDLNPNTPYAWQVKGICNDDESRFVSSFFKTKDDKLVFATDGNWNVLSNWEDAEGNAATALPTSDNNVSIEAEAVIPSGVVAQANKITIEDGGSITIEDGGQLKQSSATVKVTMEKEIETYGDSDGYYYFIASPFSGRTLYDETSDWNHVEGMLDNEGNYDLYAFDPTANKEWINYKEEPTHISFESNNGNAGLLGGEGYLYASKEGTILEFVGSTGKSYNYSETKEYTYDATATYPFNGWALVGNYFSCNAYINYIDADNNVLDADFYTLGTDNTYTLSESSIALPPCTGAFINYSATGKVQYSTENPGKRSSMLNMTMSKDRGTVDQARIRFGQGSNLAKMSFRDSNSKLYIPQDNKDYAVVYSDTESEMPLNFKAETTGRYTISFNAQEIELGYLHLIDKIEGKDIDLLTTPSYSFIGSPRDDENRFTLVYRTESTNDSFAYQSGNGVVVSGEGELQVFDVMGRNIMNTNINGVETVNVPANAVYIFKLNEKVQKIVVR